MEESVTARLAAAGCVAAEAEAAELLAGARDDAELDGWITRREAGEPLAWITGRTTFCDRPLHMDPGVYVPRPQTEALARRAARRLPTGGRAVDLCTGSGAIAVHLQAVDPTCAAIGVDLDPPAVTCARRNGVPALRADVGAVPLRDRSVDVVTAVAPYVPTGDLRLLPRDVLDHEPRLALDGGPDGLGVVRGVVATAARLLRPGGWLLLELGGEQDAALAAAGFTDVEPWHDEHGDLRGVEARARHDRPEGRPRRTR